MHTISRRDFVHTCVLGSAVLASGTAFGTPFSPNNRKGPAFLNVPLDQDWLFGGKYSDGAEQPGFNDAGFNKVTLPHTVTTLSWENWRPESWQDVWIYRRHFQSPKKSEAQRVFLEFDRVMNHAKPSLNGQPLPEHLGGYLPFSREITHLLKQDDNVLSVIVDSRWQKIPPDGNPKGTHTVDYLEPGGIPGSVRLRVLPLIFISDVFAKPLNVLSPERTVEVTCAIDSNADQVDYSSMSVRVELLDGDRRVATVTEPLKLEKPGVTEQKITLSNLGDVKLWDIDSPHLYTVRTTLLFNGEPFHEHHTRIGFREAKFTANGFFLNDRRVRLFGLDRHEIYPYTGMAMPPRVTRRDAEILKREFNCNIVRCSHYPQTEAFIDACDELGLMIWEETPGWGYLGDNAWKEIVVQNVHDMVVRDRNHPAVVIWGVRVNESKNDPPLYERTTKLAKELDGTRPCSGSMTSLKARDQGWNEDVYAMDDYHNAPDGSVGIYAPLPGIPYMLAETVGQFSYGSKGFHNQYHRSGDLALQAAQAIYHAEAHDKAAGYPRFCGVIAWCAFEYASLMNDYHTIKCPGVADVFRIPKLGATFYQSQVSPEVRPVILPAFYWDFGPKSPHGPGKKAAIFSNCERLEIFVGGKHHATAKPAYDQFKNLWYPPSFCDLEFTAGAPGELLIKGYVGERHVLTKTFSPDATHDQLSLQADDAELIGDGADATRVVFKVTDKFGNDRAFAEGKVGFVITGPGVLVGDHLFDLTDSGGVGAIWIKSVPGGSGRVTLYATHSKLGQKTVEVRVKRQTNA